MSPANSAKLAICDHLHKLGLDELEVVLEVVQGLVLGRSVYGQLVIETDARDWDKELREENRDALVYSAIAAIKRKRGA